MFKIKVDIYEDGFRVLRHTFYGEDEEEAQGYYNAHLGTDEFFRGAVEEGEWNGIELEVEEKREEEK